MDIEIWSLGKESDAYIDEGLRYYFQKTKPYNTVELVVLQVPVLAAHLEPVRVSMLVEQLVRLARQPFVRPVQLGGLMK